MTGGPTGTTAPPGLRQEYPGPSHPRPAPRGKGAAWRLWPDVPSGAPRAVFAAAIAAGAATALTEPYAVVGGPG